MILRGPTQPQLFCDSDCRKKTIISYLPQRSTSQKSSRNIAELKKSDLDNVKTTVLHFDKLRNQLQEEICILRRPKSEKSPSCPKEPNPKNECWHEELTM